MEFWGISRDLPESGLSRRDLKRVTFLSAPASFRESGENIEFMKVSARSIHRASAQWLLPRCTPRPWHLHGKKIFCGKSETYIGTTDISVCQSHRRGSR